MKKFAIFAVALLSLGFVACDDSSDLGVAQTNPQEQIMSANGLTTAYGADLQGNTLNLNAFKGKEIKVIETAEVVDLPANSEVTYMMQVADNQEFNNAADLAVNNGAVSAADWDNWFRKNVSRAPQAKENFVRFAAYVVTGGQKVRLGGENFWYAAKQVSVTPIDLNLPQEATYYLVSTSGDKAEMNHEGNQYDNPVFSLKVDVAAPEAYYIESASGKKFGVEVETKTDGKWYSLVENGNDLNVDAGQWLISVNMETNEYMIMSAVEYLYTPGNSNGWNQDNSQKLYTYNYADYMGFAYLEPGGFKFTTAPDWTHTNYGKGDEDGVLSASNNAGNLNVDAAALYWCNVNIAGLTYNLTQIESCGLIGDFNGWSEQLPLTPDEQFLVWTGTITFDAVGGFKVRFNDDWSINLGGAYFDDLTVDGANLMAPAAGTYDVKLDLSKLPYSIELTAK